MKTSVKAFVTHIVITYCSIPLIILLVMIFVVDVDDFNMVYGYNKNIINEFNSYKCVDEFAVFDYAFKTKYDGKYYFLSNYSCPPEINKKTNSTYAFDDLVVFYNDGFIYGYRYNKKTNDGYDRDIWNYALCYSSFVDSKNSTILYEINETDEPYYAIGGYDEYVYIGSTNNAYKYNIKTNVVEENETFNIPTRWIKYNNRFIEKKDIDKTSIVIEEAIEFGEDSAYIKPSDIGDDFENALIKYDFCMDSYINYLNLNKTVIVYETILRNNYYSTNGSFYVFVIYDWSSNELLYNSSFRPKYDSWRLDSVNILPHL